MMDKQQLAMVQQTLAMLAAPVEMMDAEECPAMTGHTPVQDGEWLYMAVEKAPYAMRCSADAPGAQDVLLLAAQLVRAMCVDKALNSEDSFAVYRRALRGELAGSELEALSHEHQLPDDLRRCVMIFHIVQTDSDRAYNLLRDITPMQEKDVLVDMDKHSVVLLKDVSDEDTVEDLIQYAQALQETLMEETAHTMTIGVGGVRHTLEELRESYAEARRAIEVGRTFKPEESIYVYSRLILERFLMELPADISAYYHGLLFNRRNQRLFNEEMLYTIDMFFRKDLNLSDTARQLYIHRNTLVYRLDKVQKQTGLDLRSFTDAVTFKILMELKRVSGERGAAGRLER
ncbi:MAG: helix-turn-helix domain-containing protein [Clostridia bacterium]|nr:helix-turn-helix domain-containing protein [Clostridia bacterium]